MVCHLCEAPRMVFDRGQTMENESRALEARIKHQKRDLANGLIFAKTLWMGLANSSDEHIRLMENVIQPGKR